MRKNILKRTLAFALSLALVLITPAAAFAELYEYDPVIYLHGIADTVLYENPNKYTAQPVFDTDSSNFLTGATKILLGLYQSKDGVSAAATNQITTGLNLILDPIVCNTDGNSKNSSIGPWYFNLPIYKYNTEEEIYTDNTLAISNALASRVSRDRFFVFTYDWRLDPLTNADKLLDFVEYVITYTRSEKVTIVAESYGGVITNCYLNKYPTHASQNVDTCVFLDCPLLGNTLVGDFMRGRIAKNYKDDSSLIGHYENITGKQRGEALMQYLQDDPNGVVKEFFDTVLGENVNSTLIGQLIKLMGIKIMGEANFGSDIGKAYNNLFLLQQDVIYNAGLKDFLRYMPGLWALVPEVVFDEAWDYMFGDEIVSYSLERKILDYREVLEDTADTLKQAKNNGIKMYVLANYGIQLLPAGVSLADESDGIESTKYATAGATTEECGIEWVVYNNCSNAFHDHLSPDRDINAATCALPENTWFIKGIGNCNFTNPSVTEFITWMICSGEQRNVWETGEYPQYMTYNKYKDSIVPYLGEDTGVYHYVLGDTNQDGKISSADARQVLRYAVKLETPSKMMMTVADVDGNGTVDTNDARLVLRYAVGIISNFPAE